MGIEITDILDSSSFRTLLDLAIKEDFSKLGDITTDLLKDKQQKVNANFIIKQDSIICGLHIIEKVFLLHNKDFKINYYANDGDYCTNGQVVASIEAQIKDILGFERIILNFLQRLSGIANKSYIFTKELTNSKIKILDTRKTTPGWRSLEKYAVKIGGADNHRFGLYDRVMIKDNHISSLKNQTLSDFISQAKKIYSDLLIQVEVDNLELLNDIVNTEIDIVLLDNMNFDTMKKAIDIIDNKLLIEISGNIKIGDIRKISCLNIDFISIGELTHSFNSVDISLELN